MAKHTTSALWVLPLAAVAAITSGCQKPQAPNASKLIDAATECLAAPLAGQCDRASGLGRLVSEEHEAAGGPALCSAHASSLGGAALLQVLSRDRVGASQTLDEFERNSAQAVTREKDLKTALATYRQECS